MAQKPNFEKDTCISCHLRKFSIVEIYVIFGAIFVTIFGVIFGAIFFFH